MDGLRRQGLMLGEEPSFLKYYDFKARSFAWNKQGARNQPGEPLGGWGYVFVLLAVGRLQAAIAEGKVDTVKQELLAAGAIKANEKLPKRIRVSLAWCKSCHRNQLRRVSP